MEKMANYKRRLDRIAGRIGAAGPHAPRTFAGFVQWETERRAANGGQLSPADAAWIGAAFRAFMAQAPGRRV